MNEHSTRKRENKTVNAPIDGFVQIGVTALRDPKTGEYLPAVPMYIKADAESKASEEALLQDIGRLFADRMRKYQVECKTAGVPV